MSLEIDNSYIIEKTEGFRPVYVIAAPKSENLLKGYVMKLDVSSVKIKEPLIVLTEGNEWDKKTKQRLFMFEKAEKEPGKKAKRYRYTEEELYILYESDKSKTFTKRLKNRQDLFKGGPGRLIKASYLEFVLKALVRFDKWMISPDVDKLWAYEFDYSPLYNKGKHRSYRAYQEYHVDDISVLWENREELEVLLNKFDSIRYMSMSRLFSGRIFDKNGSDIRAKNLIEELTFAAYNKLPSIVVEDTHLHETENGERIRKRISEIAKQIDDICNEEFELYREVELEKVKKDIKKLVGITMIERDDNE